MASVSSFRTGIFRGTLRVSSKPSSPLRSIERNKSPYSSQRMLFAQISPTGSRHLSLWGWGSSSKNISKIPPPPAAATTDIPEETTSQATSTLETSEATETPANADTFSNDVDVSSTPDIVPDLSDVAEAVIPAALQYGDLAAMGLAGWTPAGLVRWSMELINVSTGMSWFWTIVAATAFWRLVCLPFAIQGLRAAGKLQPIQGQMVALQTKIKEAVATRNTFELQKAKIELNKLYKENDVNPLQGLVAIVQLPLTIGVFLGVQKMCSLPVEQLHVSGISLFPDLTAVDPTFALPLAVFAAVNFQIIVGARDINTVERPDMAHFMNIIRVISFFGLYIMHSLPVGLLVSIITQAVLTAAQSLILRSDVIRRALDIPIPPPSARGKLPSFKATYQWGKKKLSGNVELARQDRIKNERNNLFNNRNNKRRL